MSLIDTDILKKILMPELTTSMLLSIFSKYEDPRGRIHDLVRKNIITSVKQGLYIVNGDLTSRPYSTELLANMIYGPSYISLETALAYYGFIPERPAKINSVTLGKGRLFHTGIGDFIYFHLNGDFYAPGVDLHEAGPRTFYLMATPEKALIDFIYFRETVKGFTKPLEFFDYLVESHRLDLHTIAERISPAQIEELSRNYSLKRVDWFVSELIRRLVK
jgi:hypothetical protein